jgi:hypothetical protein
MRKQFEKFLKEHGAYSKFCGNLKVGDDGFNSVEDFFETFRECPEDFIINAFFWDTKERIGYWRDLHNLWRKECKKQRGN